MKLSINFAYFHFVLLAIWLLILGKSIAIGLLRITRVFDANTPQILFILGASVKRSASRLRWNSRANAKWDLFSLL